MMAALTSCASVAQLPPPSFSSPPHRQQLTVELHAHLFMKEGMEWLFRGNFEGPLRATDWQSRLSSQTNPETVDRSEIGILVATLYAHPLLTNSRRNSIRRQIALAEKFVAGHPNWIIARTPAEARTALGAGKRVMILALEGADGILETEKDLQEFIDQKGIRIVTLLHLTDDQYGGVAFLRGIRGLSSPWAWLSQLFHPLYEDPNKRVRLNRNGLTDEGKRIMTELITRHVWVDLSHASDESTHAMIALQEQHHLPLLYTHTTLRKYLGAERGIAPWEIQAMKKNGGMIGLVPSEDMLEGTPVSQPCEGGIQALGQQYSELTAELPADTVVLGSDYNGAIHHLRPACALGTELDREGLWNIGQVPAVWDSLEKMRLPVPTPRAKMVERFLELWEKV